MRLNKTIVKNADAGEKKYWLGDEEVKGFGLLVLPSGVKTFYLRYRTAAGKQRTYKIGQAYELTPDQAREIARDALALVRRGDDPEQERKKAKQQPTLADLAVKYMDTHGSRKRSGNNDEILWRRHLLPDFGRTHVAALTREEVRLFHSSHPRPVTANRAVEVLSKAMALAEDWGWRPAGSNPCNGIKAHPENKRHRYLSQHELGRLNAALDQIDETADQRELRWRFSQLIRLLMLTGARLREVMEARWSWVDWERSWIAIPPDSHKAGASGEHRIIYLGERGMQILHDLHANSRSTAWVIEGATPNGPLSGYRKMWLKLLKDAEIEDLRIHDLRHTFASYSLSNGQSLGVVGQLLGHRSTQTTSRYAHLVSESARQAVDDLERRMAT